MNDELLASLEREVLGWPGVDKDPDRAHVALYRFGRRQLGHVHPATEWSTSRSPRPSTTA
jgi:hypothetical protein